MEQLTFCETTSNIFNLNDIHNSLNEIIRAACQKNDVDSKYLSIEKLKDGYAVWILNPLELEANGTKTKSVRCFKLVRKKASDNDYIDVEYLFQYKNCIEKPDDAIEKIYTSKITNKETGQTTTKQTFCHQFKSDSSTISSYLLSIIDYSIQNYQPSDKFGCCGKYVDCSDAKKCLHANKFYSKCCYYRKNLENGKIFYGKNQNI